MEASLYSLISGGSLQPALRFDAYHSTAAGEKNSPAAVLCVFVHKKLSFVFARLSFAYDPLSFCNDGNRLFLG